MLLERAEHPEWTSNAYLVADGDGGHGVLVDSNGVEAPLLNQVKQRGITITHVLVTHQHGDHVVEPRGLAKRFGVKVAGSALTKDAGVPIDETFADGDVIHSGELEIQAIATPGHCPDHFALLVNGTDCLTADCLFKGTVGGTMGGGPTGYADQVNSIMNRLMKLPPETQHPSRAHAALDGRRRVGAQPVHPHLARPRPRGNRAVPRARRGGDADPLRARLRRHLQGVGALSRRPRRDRRRQPDRTRVTGTVAATIQIREFRPALWIGCRSCLSQKADDSATRGCLHRCMQLAATDVAELVAGLPLGIELEPYRERLAPLAFAVLQGEWRRTIDKRRRGVRTARATERYGLQNEGAFEQAAVLVAESLATNERRGAVRDWARMLADASSDHVPLLAGELLALVLESEATDAGSDLIWIQVLRRSDIGGGDGPVVAQTYTCYSMCMLDRRLQILIDDARYRRLEAVARERRLSVAAVIRDAIDAALPADLATRQRAAAALLALEPMDVPATVEALKAELDDARPRPS